MLRLALALAMTTLVLRAAAAPADAGDLITRFLTRTETAPLLQSRTIRRLWARNERFHKEARLEAVATFTAESGLTYEVRARQGSKLVLDRVLLPVLEAEARAWADDTIARSALTTSNYDFAPGIEPGWLTIRPRRKDALLLDGAILVDPGDGDLRRIEGRLSKNPSFWTTRVEVAREYRRIGAVRVPVALTSRAWVRFAGLSTLDVTYEYEEINGVAVDGSAAMTR